MRKAQSQSNRTTDNVTSSDQRYYGVGTGRFGSPDPLDIKGVRLSKSGSWNRYAYVLGDPINFRDPEGTNQAPPETTCWYEEDVGWECVDAPAGGGSTWEDPPPPTAPEPTQGWASLSADCQNALTSAMPGASNDTTNATRFAALQRANDDAAGLQTATSGSTLPWQFLAAIGIVETQFRSIVQQGGGDGRGVFQIDIGKNPNVSEAPAMDLTFATNWATSVFQVNMTAILKIGNGIGLTMEALADTWNHGLGGVISDLKKGIDPDSHTTGGNYGSKVVGVMSKCFPQR